MFHRSYYYYISCIFLRTKNRWHEISEFWTLWRAVINVRNRKQPKLDPSIPNYDRSHFYSKTPASTKLFYIDEPKWVILQMAEIICWNVCQIDSIRVKIEQCDAMRCAVVWFREYINARIKRTCLKRIRANTRAEAARAIVGITSTRNESWRYLRRWN